MPARQTSRPPKLQLNRQKTKKKEKKQKEKKEKKK